MFQVHLCRCKRFARAKTAVKSDAEMNELDHNTVDLWVQSKLLGEMKCRRE